MSEHDRALSRAFDGQAPKFERSPVQSDPAALSRLVAIAALPPESRVLDVGCGPGLVSAALLEAGLRVDGVDLSSEMISLAQKRCAAFGERARFRQASVFDPTMEGRYDALISRSVLHHVIVPSAFIRRQVELLRDGGVLVLSDHTSDPDPALGQRHDAIERARDRTHTRALTPGEIVDLFASAGLFKIRMVEESFELDFDEWFDRGTPSDTKESVRSILEAGPAVRGFHAVPGLAGAMRIVCQRAIVRGIKDVGSPPSVEF